MPAKFLARLLREIAEGLERLAGFVSNAAKIAYSTSLVERPLLLPRTCPTKTPLV